MTNVIAIIERKSDGWVSIQHLPADDVIAVQAQEIARLRELHKAVKIVVTAHKEVMNKNNWRACQCKVCLIFAPLLMGETLPAADEVNLNEKGN